MNYSDLAAAADLDRRAEESSYKKRRGPVSCAECRRLKLRCDRKLPCSSCTKRGCAQICPDRTLAAGPGNRFVLADTQHLHEKIESMGKRISELEDALALLQSSFSTERHPLLVDDLMRVKAPPSTSNVPEETHDIARAITESLGTLQIGDRSQFFGFSAGSDYFVLDDVDASNHPGTESSLPLDLLLLAGSFPMTSIREARDEVWQRLAQLLPSADQAWAMVEIYYSDAAWMFMVIPRDEFMETIFTVVYDPDTPPNIETLTPHNMGLLFTIFALACMLDLNRAPYSDDGSKYYQLGRVALGLDSVIDHPSIAAIRAIENMTIFLQLCDHPNGATTCYSLLGLCAQLCYSLGLHRDDTPWDMSPKERQRRRLLFWEVCSFVCWQSVGFGKPPAFSKAHVDAKAAEDREVFLDDQGRPQHSFRSWMQSFVQSCLLTLVDQAFGVTPVTYATVLRLDRMIREHPTSESLRLVNVGCADSGMTSELTLQRNAIFVLTQKLLLYLHRSFFAQAMQDHPADPLKSKYAQSVLAAFRSAFYITASVRALYAQVPLSLRYWLFWSHAFSAAIVLGSIVIQSPGSGFAPAAWVELDRVCELFEQLAPQSKRIGKVLPQLRRLREQAHQAYTQFTIAHGALMPPRAPADATDGLDLKSLSGGTRVVDTSSPAASSRSPSSKSQSMSPERDGSSASPPPQAHALSPPLPSNTASLFPDGAAGAGSWGSAWQPLSPDTFAQLPSVLYTPQFGDAQPAAYTGEAPLATSFPLIFDQTTMLWAAESSAVVQQQLATPSPETGGAVLPGQLDATWQKFMTEIGFHDRF